eukprot:3940837-Rhodomonas_salina.4
MQEDASLHKESESHGVARGSQVVADGLDDKQGRKRGTLPPLMTSRSQDRKTDQDSMSSSTKGKKSMAS